MPDRYAILHFCPYLQLDGFVLEFWTNIPCHLTLRYTMTIPVKHQEPVLRRGLFMHSKTRYCFVAHKEIDQWEAGDTLHHSFNLPLKKKIKDVWFYTIGTIGGLESPSTSPIMHLPFDMENQNNYASSYGSPTWWHSVTYNSPKAVRFHSGAYDRLEGIALYSMGWPNNLPVQISIHRWSLFNYPIEPPVASCRLAHIPYKWQWPERDYRYYPMPSVWLASYRNYAIVAWGDPKNPAANVMNWLCYNLPPQFPGEISFRGSRTDDTWTWHEDNLFTFQFKLYTGCGYERPCATVPDNIHF